jgi:hypothetical protein
LNNNLKTIKATKKHFTTIYSESETKINQNRKKIFLQQHDPKSMKGKDYIPLILSCSTDEFGWKSDLRRKQGWELYIKIIHQ